MARIIIIGEGMLELSRKDKAWQLGYGGDTLNTAIHLARLGHDTAFLTALGTDQFSAQLRSDWAREGIDTSLILTHPHRQAGLYAIELDAAGERNFIYWRHASAASEMFELDGMTKALDIAGRADLVIFSLITLAILSSPARDRLLAFCGNFRAAGGRIAFDGNFRPRLWASLEAAREARDRAIACADIGLPTLEDEASLSGEADACAVAAHWQALGCAEAVVKLGAAGCRLPDGRIIPPPRLLQPVDTSGAGDAFNAGYLSARINGRTMADAAKDGHDLAGRVVMRHGAIPARDELEA